MATRIKKGDTVQVISGGDKGARGEVLQVRGDMVLVAGINLVKRHQKPTRMGEEGGSSKKRCPSISPTSWSSTPRQTNPPAFVLVRTKKATRLASPLKAAAFCKG